MQRNTRHHHCPTLSPIDKDLLKNKAKQNKEKESLQLKAEKFRVK